MRILMIEPSIRLAEAVRSVLRSKGYEMEIIEDPLVDTSYIKLDIYDLVILSAVRSGPDEYRLVKQVRAKDCRIPILLLTAGGNPAERVKGLECGADYCLSKPFDTRELLACIHALLRRRENQNHVLTFGNTALDPATGILTCADRCIRLSAREFDVMYLLMQSGKRNLAKETILLHVWGYDSNAVENHVEVYVGFLRKKLADIGSDITIKAVRRMGYHLETPAYALSE